MKIAMLLSGGVDSSVALALLKEQGHEVTAFYLKIWLEDEMSYLGSCPWEEDLSYARAVCEKLDIPLEVVPLQKEYHNRVVSYTIDAVKKGFTPNPDILCNSQVKFGAFVDTYGQDYDAVATGHYARSERSKLGNRELFQAPDPIKDQTYFLSMMRAQQLEKAMFPLGSLQKSDVRKMAEEFDLPTAKRKDSQGICFLGQISFTDFISHHLGTRKGNFVEKESGTVLGTHEGYYFYTIGQRRGVEVNNGPWYVVDKDVSSNTVFLSHGFSGKDYSRDHFSVRDVNWIGSDEGSLEKMIKKVKLRHGPGFYNVKKWEKVEGSDNKQYNIQIDQVDRSVTPGQYAVFYSQENQCLGGGVIME